MLVFTVIERGTYATMTLFRPGFRNKPVYIGLFDTQSGRPLPRAAAQREFGYDQYGSKSDVG